MVSGVAVSSAKVAATSAAAELVGVVVAGDSITLTGSKKKKNEMDTHTHTEKRCGWEKIDTGRCGWLDDEDGGGRQFGGLLVIAGRG